MSAWIVAKEHIDLLVHAGLHLPRHGKLRWYRTDNHWFELDRSNANEIGGKLWAENLASVAGRYPNDADGDRPGPMDFKDHDVLTYRFQEIPGRIDPVVVLKSIACYEYQSCEHAGWQDSDAKRICEALTQACVNALPGYDAAPWGFDQRRFFLDNAA